MRAILVDRHGGPEVLHLVDGPDPEPGPAELLVEVAAAGVNYMDTYGREGVPPYVGPLPWVPGGEGAGRVRAVGAGVVDVAVGDLVAWSGAPGSYAELAVVPAAVAVPVPDGVAVEVAAAVLLQGMTAHYLCTDTHPVAPGDVTVVHAAAGGVGLLLTQLVKRRGGTVVATVSGGPDGEKAALARAAGADVVSDYDDFGAAVRAAGDGAGAHVVYDGVGAATFDASLACLRPRGLLALYGAASGPVPPFELTRLSAGGSLFVTRPTLRSYTATRDELLARSGELFGLIAAGELDVRIGATFPLADARAAHEALQGRSTTGKVLLLP
ncbi:MAG TPA: quinone oxidoreductase [Acidimicrobiales bacterium]|nr:quinone oxidoreductase [Acidimicrobiales bacterium]